MLELAPAIAALVMGLACLIWGADRFIAGSAAAAHNLGVAPIVIGLTVVSIGTSAPEITVSISAALHDAGQIAVGNALGSNIANVGLVLGFTILITPITTARHLLTTEGPVLLLVTAGAGFCLYDGLLDRLESLLMLAALVVLIWATLFFKRLTPDLERTELEEEIPAMTMPIAAMWFSVGLIIMLVGAETLVWGAKMIATRAGLSQLVIGLTVVAVGTSLPELAASMVSARRGHHAIAIGNIFGSNLFNLLAVMPAAGIVAPIYLETATFYRDYLAMAGLTLLMVLAVAILHRNHRPQPMAPRRLSRGFGGSLLALYGLYYLILFAPG